MSSWVEDPVAEVRSRADIVEIISESVVLKRSGRNYLGLCPFHGERTPSFNVNPERQIFRCFGCGEGGDVFSFVMKSGHLSFPEALQQLAERYGVALPERRPEDDRKKELKDVNEMAASFFARMLEHPEIGEKARAYLEERGVSREWQAKFQLGYAPPHWDGLHRYLLSQKIPAALQEEAALVRPRSSGSGYYDYFRNRVIFPITNEAGQVVGFGARSIEPGDEPKYLNSPETPLYRKGNLLYGLNQARDAIKAKDEALLMEGYMDVITAHTYGFNHAVGVLGTALTPAQARVLLRYTPNKRVVLAFDADRAGQTAAERGLATLSDVTAGVDLEARVLAVPEGKDPDAFLRREGTAAFQQLLDDAPDLTKFLLARAIGNHDIRSHAGKLQAVLAATPVLTKIKNLMAQDDYVKWLSEKLDVRAETIRLEIKKAMGHNVTPSRAGWTTFNRKGLPAWEAEHILLFYMVEQPNVRDVVRDRLGDIPFSVNCQTIRAHIEQVVAETGVVGWHDLLDHFAGQDTQKTVSAIMFADYEKWGAEAPDIVSDAIDTLIYNYWEDQKNQLKERLNRESATLDRESLDAMTRRLQELIQFCVQLKHKRHNLLTTSQTSSEEN